MNSVTSTVPATDPLLDLQLQVARRADELFRAQPNDAPLSLNCWLRAEQEILGAATAVCDPSRLNGTAQAA